MIPSTSGEEAAYDAVPFPKEPRFWSEPAYISAAARLFGFVTAPVGEARVLEIGCASGGNIIPMAARHPRAHFVGIDISSKQIADAQMHADELDLRNLDFVHRNIESGASGLGSFDYILAHGVYSWIPVSLQEPLWRFCTEALKDGGLLYLSYNTLPFWHLKAPLRDFMLFHAQQVVDPARAVAESIAAARHVAAHTPGVFGRALTDELTYLEDQDVNYIAHDHLETENHPVYVKDIFAQAQVHGLSYVSEATPTYSTLRLLQRDVAERIVQYAGDNRTLREQYTDFYTGRGFRRSLFLKQSATVSIPLDIVTSQIDTLHILYKDLPPSIDFSDTSRSCKYFQDEFFAADSDPKFLPQRAIAEAALTHLARILPACSATVPVQDVLDAFAVQTDGSPELVEMVRAAILEFFYERKITFTTIPLQWNYDVSHPQVQRMIASDAAHGRKSSVNILHDEMYLRSETGRRLLSLLDGTRTRSELDASVLELYQEGKIAINQTPGQDLQDEQPERLVARYLDEMLLKFASLRIMSSESYPVNAGPAS